MHQVRIIAFSILLWCVSSLASNDTPRQIALAIKENAKPQVRPAWKRDLTIEIPQSPPQAAIVLLPSHQLPRAVRALINWDPTGRGDRKIMSFEDKDGKHICTVNCDNDGTLDTTSKEFQELQKAVIVPTKLEEIQDNTVSSWCSWFCCCCTSK